MKARKRSRGSISSCKIKSYVPLASRKIRSIIKRPSTADFAIGLSSKDAKVRVAGFDYRLHARTNHLTLASKLTLDQAKDLEKILQDKYRVDPLYAKKEKRYVRSGGGSPRETDELPIHNVYLAWAEKRDQRRLYRRNSSLLTTIGAVGSASARVVPWKDDDEGFRAALRNGPGYVVALGEKSVHFHTMACPKMKAARTGGANPNPLTGKRRIKAIAKSPAALYGWATKYSRAIQGPRKSWHVCRCLTLSLGLHSVRPAPRPSK
jgi:hypothetical protein